MNYVQNSVMEELIESWELAKSPNQAVSALDAFCAVPVPAGVQHTTTASHGLHPTILR